MKKITTFLSLTVGLLLLTWFIPPAKAAPAAQTTPRPTPTYKACHICGEGLPPPVVHIALFWMNGCPHCHEVIENVLPPLQEKYGAQLEVLLIEVIDMEDVDRLYEVANFYDIPRDRVGVPFLIIGDSVLIGSRQIPDELPGLIESYLTKGGVDLPAIPNLNRFRTQTTPTAQATPTKRSVIVRASLFTNPDCQECQMITSQTLNPLNQKYGEQLQIQTIDVVSPAEAAYLYQAAARYGFSKDEVNLPLLIIGDHLLMGSKIPAQFPGLVEFYLAQGGVDFPSLPPHSDSVAATPTINLSATTETPQATDTPPNHIQSNGFTLAIIVMIGMGLALLYSIISFAIGKTFQLPDWTDGLIPILIIIGIGVAAYLSYVETQSVEAVCGPVGDCNSVQQSRYATLFGFLPVSGLGLLGYLGLLTAWIIRKIFPRFSKLSNIAFFGMAVFAVVFSLYLTYLEPFVIRAVCMWCLSSAVIVTLLMLLGTPPVIRQFTPSDEEE